MVLKFDKRATDGAFLDTRTLRAKKSKRRTKYWFAVKKRPIRARKLRCCVGILPHTERWYKDGFPFINTWIVWKLLKSTTL